MSTVEIVSKIEALKEWESLAAEAVAEIEALKDTIKREMVSAPVIKCKKTPGKKCSFVAERRKKR